VIIIVRVPKPTILLRKEAEWRNALLQARTRVERERALERYNHRQVRMALEAMFDGKCAYCESKIKHVTFTHIEHYRPKSRFPEYAFDWDNLLLACGRCNEPPYKGDQFPDQTEGGPLINPCTDDPGDHFLFHYDPRIHVASVYGKTERGETTERLLGLNRADLRAYRSEQIRRLAYLKAKARTDAEAAQLLQEVLQDDAEYAAFARAL
jgi:uncharacterized protein (TIGR02646 family)